MVAMRCARRTKLMSAWGLNLVAIPVTPPWRGEPLANNPLPRKGGKSLIEPADEVLIGSCNGGSAPRRLASADLRRLTPTDTRG